MYLLTELSDVDRERAIEGWKNGPNVSTSAVQRRLSAKVRPQYRESSSSMFDEEDDIDDNEGDDDGSEDEDAEGTSSDGSSDEGDSRASKYNDDTVSSKSGELGKSGGAFTDGDKRLLAKYIAGKKGWLEGAKKEWGDFQTMVRRLLLRNILYRFFMHIFNAW